MEVALWNVHEKEDGVHFEIDVSSYKRRFDVKRRFEWYNISPLALMEYLESAYDVDVKFWISFR